MHVSHKSSRQRTRCGHHSKFFLQEELIISAAFKASLEKLMTRRLSVFARSYNSIQLILASGYEHWHSLSYQNKPRLKTMESIAAHSMIIWYQFQEKNCGKP